MNNLKLFIKYICWFTGIPIIFMVLLFLFLQNRINNSLLFTEENKNKKISELFVGDSHINNCIDDKLFKNAKKISIQSESYYFSFFKCKKIIELNSSITTIYLGFNYHNLSNYYDDCIFGVLSDQIAPKYFLMLPLNEKLKMIKANTHNVTSFCKKTITESYNFSYINAPNDDHFENTSANKNSIDKRLLFQFYKEGKIRNFSSLNIFYLEKIIALCDENKINLCFLQAPLHYYYKKGVPESYKNKYGALIKKYNKPLISFDNLHFDDNCFIPDGDHVSEKGAERASNYIIGLKK